MADGRHRQRHRRREAGEHIARRACGSTRILPAVGEAVGTGITGISRVGDRVLAGDSQHAMGRRGAEHQHQLVRRRFQIAARQIDRHRLAGDGGGAEIGGHRRMIDGGDTNGQVGLGMTQFGVIGPIADEIGADIAIVGHIGECACDRIKVLDGAVFWSGDNNESNWVIIGIGSMQGDWQGQIAGS